MPSETVKRLRDRRLNVWEQTKALADKAAMEGRVFTPREQGTWAVLREEMTDLDKRIRAEVRRDS